MRTTRSPSPPSQALPPPLPLAPPQQQQAVHHAFTYPQLSVEAHYHDGVAMAEGAETSFLTAYGLAKLLVCAQIHLRLTDKSGLFSWLLCPLEEARVMVKLAAWRRLRCGGPQAPVGGTAVPVSQGGSAALRFRDLFPASPQPTYGLPEAPSALVGGGAGIGGPLSSVDGHPLFVDVRSHLRLDVFSVMRFLCGEAYAHQSGTNPTKDGGKVAGGGSGSGAKGGGQAAAIGTNNGGSALLTAQALTQQKPQLCLSHRYCARRMGSVGGATPSLPQPPFPTSEVLVGVIGAQFNSILKAAKSTLAAMSAHANDLREQQEPQRHPNASDKPSARRRAGSMGMFLGNSDGNGDGPIVNSGGSTNNTYEQPQLALTCLRHVSLDALVAFGRTIAGTDGPQGIAESFLMADVADWLHPLSAAAGASTAFIAAARSVDSDLHMRIGGQGLGSPLSQLSPHGATVPASAGAASWGGLAALSAGWLVANRAARGTVKQLAGTADGKLAVLGAVYDFIAWIGHAHATGANLDAVAAAARAGVGFGAEGGAAPPPPPRQFITCNDLAVFCSILLSHSLAPIRTSSQQTDGVATGAAAAAAAASRAFSGASTTTSAEETPAQALDRLADGIATGEGRPWAPGGRQCGEGGILRPHPSAVEVPPGAATVVSAGKGANSGGAWEPFTGGPIGSDGGPLAGLADAHAAPFAKFFSPFYWAAVVRAATPDAPISRPMFWGFCELAARGRDGDGKIISTVVGGGGAGPGMGGGGSGNSSNSHLGGGGGGGLGIEISAADGSMAEAYAFYAPPELTLTDCLTLVVAWEVLFSGCGCAEGQPAPTSSSSPPQSPQPQQQVGSSGSVAQRVTAFTRVSQPTDALLSGNTCNGGGDNTNITTKNGKGTGYTSICSGSVGGGDASEVFSAVHFLATRARAIANDVYGGFATIGALASASGCHFLTTRVLRETHLMTATAEAQLRAFGQGQSLAAAERAMRHARDAIDRPPLSELWIANEAAKELLALPSAAALDGGGTGGAAAAGAATTSGRDKDKEKEKPTLSSLLGGVGGASLLATVGANVGIAHVPTRTAARTLQLHSAARGAAVVAYTAAEEQPLGGAAEGGSEGAGGAGGGGGDIGTSTPNRASIEDFPNNDDYGGGESAVPPGHAPSAGAAPVGKGGANSNNNNTNANASKKPSGDKDKGSSKSPRNANARFLPAASSASPTAAAAGGELTTLSAYESAFLSTLVRRATHGLTHGALAHALLTSAAAARSRLAVLADRSAAAEGISAPFLAAAAGLPLGSGTNSNVKGRGASSTPPPTTPPPAAADAFSHRLVAASAASSGAWGWATGTMLGEAGGPRHSAAERDASEWTAPLLAAYGGIADGRARLSLPVAVSGGIGGLTAYAQHVAAGSGGGASCSPLSSSASPSFLRADQPVPTTLLPFLPVGHVSFDYTNPSLPTSFAVSLAASMNAANAAAGNGAATVSASAAPVVAAAKEVIAELKAAAKRHSLLLHGSSAAVAVSAALTNPSSSPAAAASSPNGALIVSSPAAAEGSAVSASIRGVPRNQFALGAGLLSVPPPRQGASSTAIVSAQSLMEGTVVVGGGGSPLLSPSSSPLHAVGAGGGGDYSDAFEEAAAARRLTSAAAADARRNKSASGCPSVAVAVATLQWLWRFAYNDLRWQVLGFAKEVAERADRIHNVLTLERGWAGPPVAAADDGSSGGGGGGASFSPPSGSPTTRRRGGTLGGGESPASPASPTAPAPSAPLAASAPPLALPAFGGAPSAQELVNTLHRVSRLAAEVAAAKTNRRQRTLPVGGDGADDWPHRQQPLLPPSPHPSRVAAAVMELLRHRLVAMRDGIGVAADAAFGGGGSGTDDDEEATKSSAMKEKRRNTLPADDSSSSSGASSTPYPSTRSNSPTTAEHSGDTEGDNDFAFAVSAAPPAARRLADAVLSQHAEERLLAQRLAAAVAAQSAAFARRRALAAERVEAAAALQALKERSVAAVDRYAHTLEAAVREQQEAIDRRAEEALWGSAWAPEAEAEGGVEGSGDGNWASSSQRSGGGERDHASRPTTPRSHERRMALLRAEWASRTEAMLKAAGAVPLSDSHAPQGGAQATASAGAAIGGTVYTTEAAAVLRRRIEEAKERLRLVTLSPIGRWDMLQNPQ